MKIEVLNASGKGTGKSVELSDAVFAIEPNDHAIYLDVKQYLANQRQGTSKTKERGEVKGSTRKIKKQKGTGTARAGDIKNPLFVGGGRAFGPKPREYKFKLNKKVKVLARKSALSYKATDGEILVIQDLSMDSPKTKEFASVLNNLGVAEGKSLIVLGDINENVRLSSRNIEKSKVVSLSGLNTYNILNCKKLILSESAVQAIEDQLK